MVTKADFFNRIGRLLPVTMGRCPPGNCPIMLFAPVLADRAILPMAWGGRYFFNRIGQKRAVARATKYLGEHNF